MSTQNLIQDLIRDNPRINITLSGEDLHDVITSTVTEAVERMLEKKEERLFTAKEVEDRFDICPATRWRWDKLGILKAQRIGRRIYYRESDIQELLNQKGLNEDE